MPSKADTIRGGQHAGYQMETPYPGLKSATGTRLNAFILRDLSATAIRLNIRRPFRNYIPAEIYQYGDVVYTKIIPLTYKAKTSLLMSEDRARTWSEINVESDFEKELDEFEPSAGDWPMAGYKDKVLSYCVGYKDGKRQDFIKIIRPK